MQIPVKYSPNFQKKTKKMVILLTNSERIYLCIKVKGVGKHFSNDNPTSPDDMAMRNHALGLTGKCPSKRCLCDLNKFL